MTAPHLSLSLSQEMWRQILEAALPFRLSEGRFDLLGAARGAVRQLQVRENLSHLLEDKRAPAPLRRAGEQALALWNDRREDVYARLDGLVHVEGTWEVQIDEMGTDITYGPQKVEADAWVKGVAEGTLTLLQDNIRIPFRIEKRVGATVGLGRIRYDKRQACILGNVQDLAFHLGEPMIVQLIARLAETAVAQRLPMVDAVPILKREQVEGLVGGLGGPLKVAMGVDDMRLDVTEDHMTLSVRFGFAKLPEEAQIPERPPESWE